MTTPSDDAPGPGEAYEFPSVLTGHVVAPGDEPRVHGFGVDTDLSRHFRFGEVVLLTLTGEEPTAEAGRVFDLALMHVLPLSVGTAPVHATVLARLAAGRVPAVLGVAGLALAEHAAAFAEPFEALVAWAGGGATDAPPPALAGREPRAAALLAQATALGAAPPPMHSASLNHAGAVLLLFYTSGLRHRWQVEAAIMMAGLPACAAEAAHHTPMNIRSYPLNQPPFVYEGGDAP